MAKAYSTDLRVRVLADYDQGVGPAELARRYRVSERWIYILVSRREKIGTIEPLYGKPGPKPKLASHLDQLRSLVERHPDATLEELRQQLPVSVCLTTVWNALEDLKITLKKSPEGVRARSA
jgi:transposase